MSGCAQNLAPKTIAIRTFLFATLSFLSTHGMANGPTPFDQWSVTNGVIDASATCNAAGVSCTVVSQDDGFLQQQVTTANGSYIQMILTEPGASGTAGTLGFASENFTPTNNLTGWDINSQQIIRDPNQGFEQIAKIDRVPFNDANNTLVNLLHVDLQQTLVDDEFDSSFNIKKDEALLSTGEIFTGKSTDIKQNLVAATNNSPTGIKATFDTRIRSGWKLSNNNDALQIDPFAPAGDATLNKDTLAWSDGDTVASIWLSQYNDELMNGAFASQQVSNRSNDISIKNTRINPTAIIDPFDWNESTFGPAPSLP